MSHDALNEQLRQRRDKLLRRNLRQAWITRHWAELAILGLFIYVSLPFIAPTLLKVGATGPANALYTLYSPLCHQFAFRSMFIFGEQTFYPREAVGAQGLTSFDDRAASSSTFIDLYTSMRRNDIARNQSQAVADNYQFGGEAELSEWNNTLMSAARRFRGDEQMGYKVALCARDIAIYGAMVVGGVGFLLARKRLRPAPIVLYALLGLGPIGLDGFSQLLSYPPFELWATRETLPEMRMLTGALFGLMNIWLAFPYIEQSMQESAQRIEDMVAAIRAEEHGRL
jgi:uncharacterized membrane protein